MREWLLHVVVVSTGATRQTVLMPTETMNVSHVPRRDAWEHRSAPWLVVMGIVFIVTYTVAVLVIDFPAWLVLVLALLAAASWVTFAVDAVVRVALTPRGARGRWLLHHWIDLLAVVVPLLRAFRVVDGFRRIPYFQRRTGAAVRSRVALFAATYALLFVYFIALAVLQAERFAPGATITTLGDALWWAVVTIATVGYGDTYPVTAFGRVWAVVLMAGGLVIVGTTSAVVISYIQERVGRASTR